MCLLRHRATFLGRPRFQPPFQPIFEIMNCEAGHALPSRHLNNAISFGRLMQTSSVRSAVAASSSSAVSDGSAQNRAIAKDAGRSRPMPDAGGMSKALLREVEGHGAWAA